MKILFLTSNYLPNPSANGINTMNIINDLEKRGHFVSCICVASDSNDLNREIIGKTDIIRVSKSHFSEILELNTEKSTYNKIIVKINIIFRRILNMLKIYNFPSFDQTQNKKVYNKAREVLSENDYDCIIGIFKPYSNIYSLLKLKKNNKKLFVIAYFLDLLSSINKPKFMPRKLYENLIKKEYLRILNCVDGLLVPENSNEEIGMNHLLGDLKTRIVNYPTFLDQNDTESIKEKNINICEELNLIYAGTLDEQYRNPKKALEFLFNLSKSGWKINLDIYGKNNCQEIISQFNKDNFRINIKGLKTHEEIINKMKKADYLVNISNQNINAIPSKIFEMFSLARPIINFVEKSNDITLQYFNRYPSNINVFVNNTFKDNKYQFEKFVKENKNTEINKKELKNIYFKNTPEHTANQILELIGEDYVSNKKRKY